MCCLPAELRQTIHKARTWDFWGVSGTDRGRGWEGKTPSEEEDMLWSALGESPEKFSGLALFLFGGLMNPGHWG